MTQRPQRAQAAWDAPDAATDAMARWRQVYADFWLRWLFWHAANAPAYTRFSRPFYLFFAWHTSRLLRDGTLANARRLLPAGASDSQQRRFAKAVIANFYRFICDVSQIEHQPVDAMLARIERVDGMEHFRAARALQRGTILVTAHLGSFEAGLASLRQLEPHIHVLFQRDPRRRFEAMRRTLREKLGVIEAPVEEGLPAWMKLRDALAADHVVVMQGDRVMPGQRGVKVAFHGGHVMLPPGPVKLAMATGAPIVPIFAPRVSNDRVRIVIEPMIEVDASQRVVSGEHPSMTALARVIERAVNTWPEQWLMLQRAWCEDAE